MNLGLKKPLVSVVMPAYNSASTIKESVNSIFSQTYSNLELIIIDDYSDDDTIDILENNFNDDRLVIRRLGQNSGAGIARNEGIKIANGRFITFCDSDDRWLPEKLNKQISFMIEKDVSLSYSSYFICNDFGMRTHKVDILPILNHRTMLKNNYMGCLTVAYDIKKLGKRYFPEYRKRQDWGLWLDLLQSDHIAQGISEPLAVYRKGKNSLSSNKLDLVIETYKFYNNCVGMGYFRSCVWLLKFMYFYVEKNKLISKL